MKRLISFAAVVLMIAAGTKTYAQDVPVLNRVHVSGGPKIGVNLSKVDGQSWDGGYKTNLLGGIWLAVHGNRFGIQVEGLYSQTSYITGPGFDTIYKQYIQAGKDSLQNGQFRLSYFNIPIMAQVRILNRVWLQVGPQYSGVVSIRDKDEFVKDAEQLFHQGTISVVGGLWIEMTRHLNAGARYVMALSDFNKTDLESWKQRDVQIHIGYKF
jgi:hypothetical protein